MAFDKTKVVRQVGRYEFEGGGFIQVVASIDVTTEEILWWLQELIECKRKELENRTRTSDAIK